MFVIIITNGCESAWVMGTEMSLPVRVREFSESDMIVGNVPWRSVVQQMKPHDDDSDDSDDSDNVNNDNKENSDSDFDYKKEEDDSDDEVDTHNEGQAMQAVVNGKNREFVHADLPRFFVSDLTTDSKIYLYSKNWYVVLGDRVKRLDPDSYQALAVITDNMLVTHICGKKLTTPLPYTSAN